MQTIFFSLSIPSGFTKDAKYRISSVGVDTVIFAPDLIEYAFEYEFSFQMQNLRESIQIICATRFTNVCARHLCHFFSSPPKSMSILKWMRFGCAWRDFPTHHLFRMQEEHENIVIAKPCYF